MELLHVPTCLGLPLLDDSKLRAHIASQPSLLGEAVPLCLLLVKKPGFVPAMGNKTLKRRPISKIRKHKDTKRKGTTRRIPGCKE